MALSNKNMQTNDLLNYYLTMNMNNICRICLEKSNKLTPIFDPIKPPHFAILITACATVQVEEGDGLPPYICQRCISRLNIAYQFKTQCESSDVKLRQCFQNYSVSQEPNFSEYNAKEGNVSGNVQIQEITPEEHPSEKRLIEIDKVQEEIPYGKEGSSEHEVCTKEQGETNANINVIHVDTVQEARLENEVAAEEYKVEMEDDFREQERNNMIKIEDVNSLNITNSEPKNIRKIKRSTKIHQCSTCGKIFRAKPSLVHHIRIHTGERPYVCHLCQKRFINGGHLHTHMKTHTGEKNHICSVCNRGFATAQQLTKHTIAIHTSERPYGCTYCPKRFASSSNLNTHIKIHTGEKNYHCEICGKTFSTKGQLQQHLLVHTGEKAFLCEYCMRNFSQKAHLIRHLRIHNYASR